LFHFAQARFHLGTALCFFLGLYFGFQFTAGIRLCFRLLSQTRIFLGLFARFALGSFTRFFRRQRLFLCLFACFFLCFHARFGIGFGLLALRGFLFGYARRFGPRKHFGFQRLGAGFGFLACLARFLRSFLRLSFRLAARLFFRLALRHFLCFNLGLLFCFCFTRIAFG